MSAPAGLEELLIRLYLDRHVKLQLADDLGARGYDVLTTQAVGMDRASDGEQLVLAANQSRAILTFNIRDFAPLHQEWAAQGRTHAGIILSQQLGNRQYGLLLGRMLRLLNQLSAEQVRGNLVHLEQFKE
jgi:predicted nuclease of predicted toxin-antitoxin system